MQNVFEEVIGEAKERGTTVLLSSHVLAEVETLADRLSIIRDGRIIQTGTLGELRGRTQTTIHAVFERPMPAEALGIFHDVRRDGTRVSATVESSRIGDAMSMLTPYGITSLTVAPPSLESLFVRLYHQPDGERATQ